MESGSPYGSITASPEDGLGPNVRPEKKEKSNNRYMNVAIAALTVAVVLICTASISTKSSGILRSSSEAASFAATKPTSEPKVTDEMKQDHDLKKGTEAKPNIVFVLVDDLGFDEINALSTTTPFLRTLASKSLTLTQYYTQETCTPARAALMTGRYPISSGLQYGIVTSTVEFGLDLEETLLPEVLKEQGNYKNYMIGKWNLGHYTPDYLPTARGFDYFLGYMDGQNNYWSKSYPTHDQYTDFMYADTDCYYKYDGDDMTTYSSALYAQKAVQVIKEHDYDANPLFLYYASQAVHDPFTDDKNFPGADEATYTSYSTWSDMIPEATFNAAIASSDVFIRQSYALSLAVLDVAVENIYKALTHVGQIENTYLVIASDNGGCFAAGAKNGDLRGTKGSLFEGGTKVNAYVYNPKITRTGMKYTGLTHVTDWFPTILSWAGINYRADSEEYKVDGLNQAAAMAGVEGAGTPREYMLYNAIVNVEGKNLDMKTNGPVAVRNSRYKLIHAYTSNPSATYYDESLSDTYDSDVSCPQSQSMAGEFQMMLFDLINDPNETTDLYGTPAVAEDQHLLYEHLFAINSNSKQAQSTYNSELTAVMAAWDASGSFVQPWRPSTSGPKKCENSDNIFSPSYSSRKK